MLALALFLLAHFSDSCSQSFPNVQPNFIHAFVANHNPNLQLLKPKTTHLELFLLV